VLFQECVRVRLPQAFPCDDLFPPFSSPFLSLIKLLFCCVIIFCPVHLPTLVQSPTRRTAFLFPHDSEKLFESRFRETPDPHFLFPHFFVCYHIVAAPVGPTP